MEKVKFIKKYLEKTKSVIKAVTFVALNFKSFPIFFFFFNFKITSTF